MIKFSASTNALATDERTHVVGEDARRPPALWRPALPTCGVRRVCGARIGLNCSRMNDAYRLDSGGRWSARLGRLRADGESGRIRVRALGTLWRLSLLLSARVVGRGRPLNRRLQLTISPSRTFENSHQVERHRRLCATSAALPPSVGATLMMSSAVAKLKNCASLAAGRKYERKLWQNAAARTSLFIASSLGLAAAAATRAAAAMNELMTAAAAAAARGCAGG